MIERGEPSTRPLTAGQRAQLLGRSLPLVGFGAMCAIYLVVAYLKIIPPPGVYVYLFMGVVILFVGREAAQGLIDLGSGVARVEIDSLVRHGRSSGRSNHFYGKFERLGTLRMSSRVGMAAANGQRYRVVYSPASRVVWALEPA